MLRIASTHRTLIALGVCVGFGVGCTASTHNDGAIADSNGGDAETDASSAPDGGPNPFVITIENFTFIPQSLEVPPGTTITVRNLDSMVHSVTSETLPGVFSFGAVNGIAFDTGAFIGEKEIVIPQSASVGTIVPYFCTVHRGSMRNEGQISVGAPG
jgi:plastocyanin